jgi:hypothetical protein
MTPISTLHGQPCKPGSVLGDPLTATGAIAASGTEGTAWPGLSRE